VLEGVILDQLAQIITGTNEIRVSHERLRTEHYELRLDRDAISARLVAATEHLERLRAELGTVAPSDVQALVSERGELVTRVNRLQDEKRDLMQHLEESAAALRAAREDGQQQRERLAVVRDELASARADLTRTGEESREAKQRCKELQDQNEQLVKAQARRESEHEALLAAERAARQQLAEEVLALNANAEETARVTAQLLSASMNHSTNGTSLPASELDALRLHASELKSKLDEANHLYCVMAETLDGFGRQIAALLPQDQAFGFVNEPVSPGCRLPHLRLNVDRSGSQR
jgi:chromosome segregation ATPase